MGAPALDAGLLCSPGGTNPPGREQRGARQQDAQLTNKGTALQPACASQTDRHQPDDALFTGSGDHPITSAPTSVSGGSGSPQEPQGRPEEGRSISVQGLGLPGTFGGTRSRFCFLGFFCFCLLVGWLVGFLLLFVLKSCCECGAAAFGSLSDVAWKQDFAKDRESTTELNFLTPLHVTRVAPSEVWVGTTRDAFAGELGTGIRSLVYRVSLSGVGLWLPGFYRPHGALSWAPFV